MPACCPAECASWTVHAVSTTHDFISAVQEEPYGDIMLGRSTKLDYV
jgi:hypothetical protein